jgi:hypothetical protein
METVNLEIPRKQARQLYREYKKHLHYSTPVDDEIRRAYQLMAQGRLIVKAIESVAKAGLNDKKLPKLALVRADAMECKLITHHDGSATMTSEPRLWRRGNAAASKWIDFPVGSFPGVSSSFRGHIAIVPGVPVHLRPKRGLANYHILWEAEWSRVIPKDPMLVRRIGAQADLWLVVASWDLTEVERTVLASRLANA